jgi:hypothetical protein
LSVPHFKCVACRNRLSTSEDRDDGVGDLCPDCGSLLEPVSELSEIVGFRSIQARGTADFASAHQRLADRVGEIRAEREARAGRDPLDPSRWLDEDGSFDPEAVGQALARPRSELHS